MSRVNQAPAISCWGAPLSPGLIARAQPMTFVNESFCNLLCLAGECDQIPGDQKHSTKKTWGQGKSSTQMCLGSRDMLVSWRVIHLGS